MTVYVTIYINEYSRSINILKKYGALSAVVEFLDWADAGDVYRDTVRCDLVIILICEQGGSRWSICRALTNER